MHTSAIPLLGRIRWLRTAALIAVVGASACGGGLRNPFGSRSGTAVGEIRLFVENQNFNDLRIYALTTRGPQAMGQVGGNSTRNFTLDWRQLEELRFRLEFLAGRQYRTNAVNVAPGDRLELIVPANPANAYLRRR